MYSIIQDDKYGDKVVALNDTDTYIQDLAVNHKRFLNASTQKLTPLDTDPTDKSRTIYNIPLQIGSRKQPVRVLVDTGSSWTVIKTCEECSDTRMFDRSKSTSLECTSYLKIIKYGTSQVQGQWCSDFVGVDGLEAKMPLILDSKSRLPLDGLI